MDKPKAIIQTIAVDPHVANDIGVYVNGQLIKSFNSLSDDYAMTNACTFKEKYNDNDINRRN